MKELANNESNEMACGPIEKLNERKRFDPKNGAWGNISKFFLIYRKIDFFEIAAWSHDTQQNDTLHDDNQQSDNENNYTQYSYTKHNLTSHSIMPQHSAE